MTNMTEKVIDAISAAIPNEYPEGYVARRVIALAVIAAHIEVLMEPTDAMLESVGTINGWDGAFGRADQDHKDWWKAMLRASQEVDDD